MSVLTAQALLAKGSLGADIQPVPHSSKEPYTLMRPESAKMESHFFPIHAKFQSGCYSPDHRGLISSIQKKKITNQ